MIKIERCTICNRGRGANVHTKSKNEAYTIKAKGMLCGTFKDSRENWIASIPTSVT